MGKRIYYNPTSDVTEDRIGRRLHPWHFGDHASAIAELLPGEHLYAACDKGPFWNVVCVDDAETFKSFLDQYNLGHAITFNLYALSAEDHERAAQSPI
jgi:hypothetical protein